MATNPSIRLGAKPQAALVLGLFVALTIAVNVVMLRRRFRPLERLVDEMERADLSRPGAHLPARRTAAPSPRRWRAYTRPSA